MDSWRCEFEHLSLEEKIAFDEYMREYGDGRPGPEDLRFRLTPVAADAKSAPLNSDS